MIETSISMTHATDRRGFLKGAVATVALMGGLGIAPARAASPNEKLQLAFIGCGGMGNMHLDWFANRADVRVVALCDVDRDHLERASQRAPNALKTSDFREVVGRDDVDAVIIATPDHWHALVAVSAVKAGKQIYCEKPLANSIGEGRAIADAVKQAGVVLQTGSHERSSPGATLAKQLVASGKLGQIERVEIRLPNTDAHLREVENFRSPPADSKPPAALDYDAWLGHTPLVPYNEKRCHFWWRFHSRYGGGEMTDRGAHVIDLAHYILGLDETGPVVVDAQGEPPEGSFFDAFITFKFVNTYANGLKLLGSNAEPRGLTIVGSEGRLAVAVHGCELTAEPGSLLDGIKQSHIDTYGAHRENWLAAIRGDAAVVAPVEAGHRTASVCHLNNLAMRLGERLQWDPASEKSHSRAANALLMPEMREPWVL